VMMGRRWGWEGGERDAGKEVSDSGSWMMLMTMTAAIDCSPILLRACPVFSDL
jgi:hypothetical protein